MTGPVFKVIGYGGAPGRRPSHSIISLLAAKKCGADAVAVNVWRTRDGVLVTAEEPVLSTPVGRRPIAETPYSIVRNTFLGGRYRVPSYLEALRTAREYDLGIMVFPQEGLESVAEEWIVRMEVSDRAILVLRSSDAARLLEELGSPVKRAAMPGEDGFDTTLFQAVVGPASTVERYVGKIETYVMALEEDAAQYLGRFTGVITKDPCGLKEAR